MEDFDCKYYAVRYLQQTCDSFLKNYPIIYDKELNNGANRDYLFMKEMFDIMINIDVISSVFLEHGDKINPDYVLEKLNVMKSQLDTQIRYWKNKE